MILQITQLQPLEQLSCQGEQGAHCRAHLYHCPGAKVSSSGGQDGEGTGRAVLGFPGAGAQAAWVCQEVKEEELEK